MPDTHVRYHGRRYHAPLDVRLLVRAGRGDMRAEVRDAEGRLIRTFPQVPEDGTHGQSAAGDVSRRADAFVDHLGHGGWHLSVSQILVLAALGALLLAILVPWCLSTMNAT
jgi:hypothetical protein